MTLNKSSIYPVYANKGKEGLFCFLSKDTMYKVAPVGSNSGNPGLTIDYYKTRKMVIKHSAFIHNCQITKETFVTLYRALFNAALEKMI